MANDQGVVGIYSYIDTTVEGVKKIKEAGYKNFRVFSPLPHREIEELIEGGESPVRFFTLTGAAFGVLCGLTLTILTSLAWPLRVSAKPIAAIPPFMIIVFELTILFGVLLTFASMLYYARLRRNAPLSLYDPRFSEDKFGVAVICEKSQIEDVEKILRSSGAEEVRFEGV